MITVLFCVMADIRDSILYSREEWAGAREVWRERFVTRMLGMVTRDRAGNEPS